MPQVEVLKITRKNMQSVASLRVAKENLEQEVSYLYSWLLIKAYKLKVEYLLF